MLHRANYMGLFADRLLHSRHKISSKLTYIVVLTWLSGLAAFAQGPKGDAPPKLDKRDEIVDQFILWDIGQLRGPAGDRAREQFEQLNGEAAIPAIVRGCNKAAKLQASCPIMVLSMKLQSLMRNTQNQDSLRHIVASLDPPGQASYYGSYLESMRQLAQNRLEQLHGRRDRASTLSGGGTAAQLKRSRIEIETWTLADLRAAVAEDRGADLVRALEELKTRKGAEYTDALAKAVGDLEGESKLIARGLLAQRLVRMTEATLTDKLKDRNAEVRAAAALAVGYKQASLHYQLAEALADVDPLVANNAHISIVKLLGEDFGPPEGAGVLERFEASRRWKRWLDERKAN